MSGFLAPSGRDFLVHLLLMEHFSSRMRTPDLSADSRSAVGSHATTLNMSKTSFGSALWRLLCLVAFALVLGGAAQAQTQTTLNITALDPSLEGAPARFRLTLSRPATQRLTVFFFTQSGFGVTGANELPNGPFAADYNRITRDVTFETGTSDLIVSVPTNQDNTYEYDETFTANISNPRFNGAFANGLTITQSSATGVILNDDNPPTVSLIAPPPILEGDSNNLQRQNDNFTLDINPIAERPLELALTTRDGTATASGPNADYVPVNNAQIEVPPGTRQVPYSVVVLGDDIYEGDENFSLTVTFSPTLAGTAASTAVAVITDNDLPTYSIDDSRASVVEGQDAFFRISLLDRQGQPVSALSDINFTYDFQDVTATLGPLPAPTPFDYSDANADPATPGKSGSFTIRPGMRDFTLRVPTVDDNIQEQVETFNLIINRASGTLAPLGNGNIGRGQITDNDSAPQINIADASVVEGTGPTPTSLIFTVSLTSVTSQPVTVDYQTVAQNPGVGIADPNSDYNATTGRVTFGPNQATAQFTVPIVADSINEPNETLRVRLFNPGNASFSNNASEIFATGTIIDDDTAGTVSMAQAGQNVPENVSGGIVNVLVNFVPNGVPARPVTVDFTTIPGTAVQSGQRDYFGKTGRITFNPRAGSTSLAIPIEIIDDNIREGDETFTVRLTAVNGADLLAGATDTVVTIIDNEALPQVRITPADARVGENAGKQKFTVSLLGRSQAPVTVNYAFVDGTATNGTDYAGTDGAVTFLPGGDASFAIPYSINDDLIAEGDETFSVQLTGTPDTAGLTNFAFENGRTSATATIVDNERTPDLTIGDASVLEGSTGDINSGAVLNFPVTLSRPSSRPSSFIYSTLNLRQSDCTPANGCDVASDDDYAGVRNVVVTIPAGQTTATIAIKVAPDALNEFNEQFSVVARNLVNLVPSVSTGPVQRFGSVAYGTILNDDAGGVITIKGPTDPITEGYKRGVEPSSTVIGQVANFTVTLPTPAGRPVTVTYKTTGSAKAADIEDLTTGVGKTGIGANGELEGKLTFFPGTTTRSIALRAIGDNEVEGLENLTVMISIQENNGVNSYTVDPRANSASVGIIDRTPSVQSFTPSVGFPAYGTIAATKVTINGRLLRTDGNPRVDSVLFNGVAVGRGGIQYTSDNALVVSVPRGARSGLITLKLVDGSTTIGIPVVAGVPNAVAPSFFVQPVIDSFTPTTGVPNATTITITGRNFQDGANEVTGVQFTGGLVQVSPTGVKVLSDTQIQVVVPATAGTGPLRIVSDKGGVGPASQTIFNGVSARAGSLRFGDNPDNTPILEGSKGTVVQPVRNFSSTGDATTTHRPYQVFVVPATQTSGPNAGQPITPQTPITVRVTIRSSINGTTSSDRIPQIAVRADLTAQGRPTFLKYSTNQTSTTPAGTVDVPVPASFNPASPLEVFIVDSGTDNVPPVEGQPGAIVTITASILTSDTPSLFAPGGQGVSVSVERRQIITPGNQTAIVFGAGTNTDFSIPYATNANGTVAQTEVFDSAPTNSSGTVRFYQVYRFDTANQLNNRTTAGDFKPVGNEERLQRGVGYRLVVADRDVRLNARGSNLQVISANSFAINLTRNIPLATNSSATANATNGYNYIGFPFDNTRFSGVNLNDATVTVDGATRSYSDAVAAGLINSQLFTVDDQGVLNAVTGDPIIRPFKAYFVQVYRNNLTLTLNNPSP